MDEVPQKRPETQSHPACEITLPKRPRSDQFQTQSAVTGENGGRDISALNARKVSPTNGNDDNDDDDDDDDDDYTSSSGSSLSSSDDEDEDDNHSENAENLNGLSGSSEEVTSLPARRKPHIRRINQEPSLFSRLSAFLPQMKTANDDLQREIDAGRGKDIRLDNDEEEGDSHDDEEGQYIEMNLGLGVLEEKRPDDERNPLEGDSKDSRSTGSETNVLDHLMGKEKTSPSAKPSIQDLGN
ncbi:hypothetical protein BJY04DRAFT_165538 [Aspergillus karnatakaensis]|uniref:NOPCHAP1/New4 family protein n=1 Tax=Aspergillus karnatakaensis TaxID=1810916 RepID=UPI003CCCAA94